MNHHAKTPLDTHHVVWHIPSPHAHTFTHGDRTGSLGSGAAGNALGEGTMRMRILGGAAAALVLGLSVSARAADNDAAPSSGGHWYDPFGLFASKERDVAAEL